MARFEFRLRTLLGIREAERDAQRLQLAELLTAEERLRDQEARVAAELHCELSARRDVTTQGRLDVDHLRAAYLFEHALRDELQVLGQRQQALKSIVSAQQAVLVEAQRQVRVLEKLRERQQRQHFAAQQTAESRMLDEAGARLSRPVG